jgi:hypothetical protein
VQNDKEELQRLVKEAATDEEALELVKEDAEQAESEASLARYQIEVAFACFSLGSCSF